MCTDPFGSLGLGSLVDILIASGKDVALSWGETFYNLIGIIFIA
jgi:hypothetical protein